MASEKSPDFVCGQILFSLKMSKLNYLVNETPYSAYITIRKKFIKNNDESQDNLAYTNKNDEESELLRLKDRNKDLETRLAIAKVEFEESELMKQKLLTEISNRDDEIEKCLKNERLLNERIKSVTDEKEVMKSTIETISREKVNIVKKLEENIKILENDVEFGIVKIDTLEKELRMLEDKLNNVPKLSPPINFTSESVPSTSKCGECDYESDDEIELETHLKSNHVDQNSQDGNNHMKTNLLFKCDICAFNARKVEDLSKHKQEEHQKNCIHCDFNTHSKESLNMHMMEKHKLTCGKCQLTSKDEWKHNIHVCKVHINNPIHEQFYTKISASADGGPRSRVCARLTLRSAPHRH